MELSRNNEGALTYSVKYKKKTIIQPSRLGLTLEKHPDFDSGFNFSVLDTRDHQGTLKSRLGERAKVDYEWKEFNLTVKQDSTDRIFKIVFRLLDEAVAFRYEVPQQTQLTEYAISGELTEFALSPHAVAFTEYGHEGEYVPQPMAPIRRGCWMPLLVQNKEEGLSHAILQADAEDYARRFLYSKGSVGTLAVSLASKVKAKGSYKTPWHIVVTANSDSKLIELNYIRDALIDNRLPEPNWIVPGKAIRITDLTTKAGIEGIDFAAANGLQFVEYDAGWYGDQKNPKHDATTCIRNLSVEDVCKYGKTKGIGVILYVNKIHLRHQHDKIFPTYKKWGVAGLKFGFVDGKTQEGITETHKWVRLALENEMIVDIHDNYRPSGMTQRYPNLLTQEGIRGNEWRPTSRHNTTMPFTRFIAGAGDYTFCYPGGGKTTNVHQLALTVVCFSPLQFPYWYGRPKDYTNSLGKDWFKIVPVTWDDTKVLFGEVGEYYAIARKKGNDWFVGGITNEFKRTFDFSLKFLDPKKSYQATVFRDTEGKELEKENLSVSSKSILREHLKANGGVTIVIKQAPSSQRL